MTLTLFHLGIAIARAIVRIIWRQSFHFTSKPFAPLITTGNRSATATTFHSAKVLCAAPASPAVSNYLEFSSTLRQRSVRVPLPVRSRQVAHVVLYAASSGVPLCGAEMGKESAKELIMVWSFVV